MSGYIEKQLMEMFNRMLNHFGPQEWWPGDGPFEMMVGAILTQNTNWKNVEKALTNLKKNDLLSIQKMHCVSVEKLADNIRPSGYYNIKAKRLKNLISFLVEEYEYDIDRLFSEDIETQRRSLLSVKGIGPETADCIILYAAEKPVFVIDSYTYRILSRHNMADDPTTYDELQDLFMSNLEPDNKIFNEFHALIVMTGKEYCKKEPRCDNCPLKGFGDNL